MLITPLSQIYPEMKRVTETVGLNEKTTGRKTDQTAAELNERSADLELDQEAVLAADARCFFLYAL